jgi:hypothetical protein
MTCLNDSHIQALADGEPLPDAAAHAAGCVACAARLRERQALMATITSAVDVPSIMPARVQDGVRLRLKADTTGLQGGTRLRTTDSGDSGLQAGRTWIFSGLAVAAATIIAVLFVAPAIRKPDSTVSASEILARSATHLSAVVTSGVEVLEYEVVLDGVPKDMLPDQVDGTYRVWQVIDHDVPGRFRFATYAPDGRMLTSIAEDPLKKRRVASFISEGQPYRFDVSLPANTTNMSLPEMQQLHMQASITMMQASGNQLLDTVDGPDGKLYRIEVPRVSGPGSNPVWDLSEARVVIDARDYRITEFAVRGSFLKQGYSMSYKLINHVLGASVKADAFEVPAQVGEIVISGEGTAVPTHDVVVLALRELTKMKQAR